MKTAGALALLVLLDICLATGTGIAIARAEPALQEAAGQATTREAYEGQARARSGAPAYATTYSAYMSPLTFSLQLKTSNLAVSAGHPVWVITVHTFHHCSDCAAEQPTAAGWMYSVVYDAKTGREADYCSGCGLLLQSRYDGVGERALAAAPDWFRQALEGPFRRL